MNVTAKEIAEKLNVSPSAVSLALNGKPGVSEATRSRILQLAAAMGYRSSLISEKAKSTRSIRYVIFTDGGNVVKEISFHSIILQGIEAKAKELGYNVLVSYLDKQDCTPERIAALAEDVLGILLLGTEFQRQDSCCTTILSILKCPVVIVDNKLFRNDADCVATDNVHGAYQAIEHLCRWGHRRIGYFTSIQRIPNFDERDHGVNLAAADHPGLQIERIPVNFSTKKAYNDICAWLEGREDLPTAFFADSDIIAFGAIQAFVQKGYRVPEDISVVGFDDMPACEMISPPLSSVRVMKTQTGAIALQLLHDRIESPKDDMLLGTPFHLTVSTVLKERNSVASPR